MLTQEQVHLKKEIRKNMNKLLIILFVICSCNSNQMTNDKNITEGISVIEKDKLNEMISVALKNNDTLLYNKVSSYFLLNNMGEEFLLTALMMANKYNNAEACFHVFDIIAYSTPKEPKQALEVMDLKTKNLALYYLLKSNEMGFKSAKYQVAEIFGKGKVPPKSLYYLQEFSKE